MVSGLDSVINGTSRQLFGKESDSTTGSSIPRGCTQHISRSGGRMQGKSRTLSLTPEKERLQDLAAKEDQVGLRIPKLGGKSKHVLQNYIIRL